MIVLQINIESKINIESNYGSTGRIVEGIGRLAQSQGIETHVAYSRGANPSRLNTHHIGNKLSQGLHLVRTRVFGDHLKGSGFSTKQLIKLIEKLDPNIVHIHQVHGYYLHVPILFKYLRKSDRKIVWTLHDCWSYTGHCSYYTKIGCQKWLKECHNCPQFSGYPKSYFFDRSKEEFNLKKELFASMQNLHLVAISDWLKEEVSKSILAELPISVIKNGVDLEIFKPIKFNKELEKKKRGITSKNVVIATGTTWNSSKGLEDYKKLGAKLPNNTTLLLVGIPTYLQVGFPNSTICIERTESKEELSLLYNIADVVLSLSYQESFGLTIPEGLACGTPGVAYRNTALKEHISEHTGKLVMTGNIQEASQAIAEVIEVGKSAMSEACISFCHKNYNLKNNYQNYLSLYSQLIA
jgi:glycosyltransferase involved in cell wall biosynthesis